jgi:hypothetical protein
VSKLTFCCWSGIAHTYQKFGKIAVALYFLAFLLKTWISILIDVNSRYHYYHNYIEYNISFCKSLKFYLYFGGIDGMDMTGVHKCSGALTNISLV